ncbi:MULTISPECIES: gamma-glutamyltransferase [Spirulina sp. CCY15215]|uniref:gamma-glutamyltransferase n=1 Tax=Spirulina sp. CCY15215 TaxID=2767591 RepID=UPI0019504449|nr:gamma-glutamyltransferase [Spirulina major]
MTITKLKTRGIIAAGHPKTAAAGNEIFLAGGNAFDATVAAILASFVVEPTLTSAGGGGFLLAHTQDSCNILFDFFSQTPRQKRPLEEVDFYEVDVNFGDAVQAFHIGLGSMAVPGNIAGVFAVHQQLGRLPFKVIAEPAIALAKNGVVVTPFQGFCISELLAPILQVLPESRKIFAPGDRLLQCGDILYCSDFAATLTALVEEGQDLFYQGEIARQLVQDSREKGGYLTLEDLQAYQVIYRQPLAIDYRGRKMLTNPPPSSGGALIAFALKLLETVDFQALEFGSDRHLQILSRIMCLTNEARKDGYDARIYQENIADEFLSADHVSQYCQTLQGIVNKWGSTTHISVMDEDGNAATATTSNGEGSSYVIPGTGVMMNNMLGEADLNPSGFHQWQCDRRISSMMAPTLVLQNDKPEIVLGSGGSNRIRTAILQVISNLIDFNFSIEEAINNPRIHWENGLFSIEPPYREETLKNLALPPGTSIQNWREKNMFFGGVHGVRKTADGTLEGAGDPRRGGAVSVQN